DRRGRPGGRRRVPRLQRHPGHAGGLLVPGSAVPAGDAVDRRRPVRRDDGRLPAAPPHERLRRPLMTAPIIAPPRSRATTRTNVEMIGWVFMRLSGVALLVLIFGHLFANLMVGDGIKSIDFGF